MPILFQNSKIEVPLHLAPNKVPVFSETTLAALRGLNPVLKLEL